MTLRTNVLHAMGRGGLIMRRQRVTAAVFVASRLALMRCSCGRTYRGRVNVVWVAIGVCREIPCRAQC